MPGMSLLTTDRPFSLKNSSTTLSTPSIPASNDGMGSKLTYYVVPSLEKMGEAARLATEGNQHPRLRSPTQGG